MLTIFAPIFTSFSRSVVRDQCFTSFGKDDGLLTMGGILGLRLEADWVVLSACNTGSGEDAGAEAVSGLGRAFFHAPSRPPTAS